ncbi:hypothetical protein FRC03_010568 [Tulasnella sp. 419]|nr:hypothetical protein FRC03_010568 [Tulasnella sp. 419]
MYDARKTADLKSICLPQKAFNKRRTQGSTGLRATLVANLWPNSAKIHQRRQRSWSSMSSPTTNGYWAQFQDDFKGLVIN